MRDARLQKLAGAVNASEFAGIALNAGPSLQYLTGLDFHLMERPVVFVFIPGKAPVFILPRLEAAKVEGETEAKTFFYDENPREWGSVFRKALQSLEIGSGRIGVEPLQFRYLEYNLLQEAGDVALADGSHLIAELRSRKDEQEIELMRQAVAIAENSLRAVIPRIRMGMSEKELASELVIQLFRHGSDPDLPFEPIVSGGPNGANPHAGPSSRKLQEGDLLVIDWGARYQGYASDLTRTLAIGEVDEESLRIHEIVQQANAAGIAAGKVGAACSEVDHAARKVIEAAGYGEYFTHRTGHGIGMQCHEEPYIHKDNDAILQTGMTYTVEPGIYLPGKNGVRIEDDVYLSEDGPVSLSSLERGVIKIV